MLKNLPSKLAAACGIVVLGLAAASSAQAQADPTNTEFTMGGRSHSGVATCPAVMWHVSPIPRGVASPINGVAYYSDMSGFSVVKGTMGSDGKVAATVTSISGNGPAGMVSGLRDKNATHIEMHGAGCAETKFDLQRFVPSAAGDGPG